MKRRDQIYTETTSTPGDFVFDDRVAHVFTDMINRSVPGYSLLLDMLGVVTGNYARPETTCYDLGCSLGASTLALRCRLDEISAKTGEQFSLVGIDSSAAMTERCRENLAKVPGPTNTRIFCQRLQDTDISNASLVVLNFTLQFLPVEERLAALTKIATGTLPGGALVLSEKVASRHPQSDALMTDLHHGFKQSKGYSSLEIARKRTALENVLIPESVSCHRDRLHSAGFRHTAVWFQCFNFISLIAIK